MPSVKTPVFFVIGCTGSGKSKVSVGLAEDLISTHCYTHVVIINCDVYQCFSSLPISTNKPTHEDFRGVRHVGFGFLNDDGSPLPSCKSSCPEELFFYEEVNKSFAESRTFNVHSYERVVTSFINWYFGQYEDAAVIICGGTCYYAQSLLFRNCLVSDGKNCSSDLTNSDLDSEEDLWERLKAVDPVTAARYHPNDRRRIRRLLEIYSTTGQTPTDVFAAKEVSLRFESSSIFVVWVRMDRTALIEQLNMRVERMLQSGILDEAKSFWLKAHGQLPPGSLSEAIGFKEFSQFFSTMKPSLISSDEITEAVEQVKANTRRYARQQERWIQNRLIPQLHASSLKNDWHHFVIFWTDENAETSSCIQALSNTLFDALAARAVEETRFPLKQPLRTRAPVSQVLCEVCRTLVYGREQMAVHLKSKRHKGALRRLAVEKEQKERYGRELPPPKRKRSS